MSLVTKAKLTTVLGTALVLGCVALTMSPATSAQEGQGQGGTDPVVAIERLLTEAGLFFQKQDNNGKVQFKVAIEAGGKTSMITLYAHTWTWTMTDGSPLHSVYCYTPVKSTDAQNPFSPAVAQAVSQYNDTLLTGNCSVSSEGIYANSGFYLPGLQADMLSNYLYALHWNNVGLQDALAPVFAAESAEN
jgi:hypothetical protein